MRDLDPQAMALAFDGLDFGTESFPAEEVPLLSVGGVSGYLKSLLAGDPYLARLWVVGEVSSCQCNRNGHLFLTLVDPESGDVLKGVVWQSQTARLSFWPEVGQQVLALGQIGIYSGGSYYRLVIWQLLPAGEGLLAWRLQQLKARLAAEGLFDNQRPLPTHPQCIAVVSSPDAAGWGDIRRTLNQRYPGLRVLFSPAQVQGEAAPESIVRAIRRVARDGRAEVLLIARGGGSGEDLACFDDERVVRAIAECPIPVVTGIGHQRDETLADYAADYAAHTPTAAAERIVPDLRELQRQGSQLRQKLIERTLQALERARRRFQHTQRHLAQIHPERLLQQAQESLTQRQQRLVQAVRHRFHHHQQRQQALQEHLQALDPAAVLRRGYALVRDERGSLVRTHHLPPQTRLRIQLASGSLWARVEESHEPPQT
ncbi:exodeoxyribonuclease VII large subunit [Synechococcus sp. H55.10]|uniref:exodeoxyribonuclease VII large subunit n=1 Tax=Synechococcus sp. H55.10 TaxID=2964503 RepID=UPI0039C74BE1